MMKFTYTFLIMTLLLCSQLWATETDWDAKEATQEVRGELMFKKNNLKYLREAINKKKTSIYQSIEELKDAFITDDEGKLKNIIYVPGGLYNKLEEILEMSATYDQEVESYRAYSFRSFQNAQRKTINSNKPLPNEEFNEVLAEIFSQMSPQNQKTISTQVSRMKNEEKTRRILIEIKNKIPGMPLNRKHEDAYDDRAFLDEEKENYIKLMELFSKLAEYYTDRDSSPEGIENYTEILDRLNTLVNNLKPESSDLVKNPYLE